MQSLETIYREIHNRTMTELNNEVLSNKNNQILLIKLINSANPKSLHSILYRSSDFWATLNLCSAIRNNFTDCFINSTGVFTLVLSYLKHIPCEC